MSTPTRLRTAPTDAAAHGDDATEARPRRLRVLIADDQPEHLEMIARTIERSEQAARIDLVRAQDGIEAWDHVKTGIDLAFLDIRMPGCSGLELVARIRHDPDVSALPVVIVSSSSDPHDVQAASALGVAAYVEKGRVGPFRARIHDVLARLVPGQPL